MNRPGSVLITGASTGIGRATALHLDQRGWNVYAGVRKESDGEVLRKDASDRLRTLHLDVTDQDSIEAAISAIREGGSGLDALVNNAGISVNGPLEFIQLSEMRRMFDVNFFGLVAMTQAALPLIRETTGRIVHIGSMGGRHALPLIGAYCATKHAIEAIGEAQRRELSPWGIEVVVIEPGSVATPVWEKARDAAAARQTSRSPREAELYGPAIDVVTTRVQGAERSAISPEEVAKVVEKALTVPRPQPRYLVGKDAKLHARMARLLSDRLRDKVVLRAMKYPRRL
jgi:NAD(P)-dependent dehydrogenase (short-subunit alcohol dehydrogenase family)